MDAIYYLSLGKSAINTNDDENIRKREFYFRIEAHYSNNNTYKCYYENKSGKKLFENDNIYKSLRKHIGKIPIVFVKPLDINLLRGYNQSRRKFFDTLISQTDEDYLNKLVDYNRLIKQRNSYIKNANTLKSIESDIIRTYNEKLVELNLFLSKIRKETSKNLNKEFNDVSEKVAPQNRPKR